jgi:hypothetical protein
MKVELKRRPDGFRYPLQPAYISGILTAKTAQSEQVIIGPPLDVPKGIALFFDSEGEFLRADDEFFSECPSSADSFGMNSLAVLFAEKQELNESLGLELATIRVKKFAARAGQFYFCIRDYPLHFEDLVAHDLQDEGMPLENREGLRRSIEHWFEQGYFELDWADGLYEVTRQGIIYGT